MYRTCIRDREVGNIRDNVQRIPLSLVQEHVNPVRCTLNIKSFMLQHTKIHGSTTLSFNLHRRHVICTARDYGCLTRETRERKRVTSNAWRVDASGRETEDWSIAWKYLQRVDSRVDRERKSSVVMSIDVVDIPEDVCSRKLGKILPFRRVTLLIFLSARLQRKSFSQIQRIFLEEIGQSFQVQTVLSFAVRV